MMEPRTLPTSPFHIAIIGAGIAGLSTALFLLQFYSGAYPLTITIYEQSHQSRPNSFPGTDTTRSSTPDSSHRKTNTITASTTGAGLGLGVNATKLLHRVGLGQALMEISTHSCRDEVWFSFRRWDDSTEVVTVRSPILKTYGQGEARGIAVARGELLKVLWAGVERGLERMTQLFEGQIHEKMDWMLTGGRIEVGKRVTGVEDLVDTVRLKFEDDTTATANLVIACDGIHSPIRSQFVHDVPIYSGRVAYRGLIPLEKLPSPWPFPTYSVLWVGPGKHIVIYAINKNLLNFVGVVSKDENETRAFRESWNITCDRKEVETEFSDFDNVVHKIISLLPEKPSKWLLNDRDPITDWTFLDGKVVLLGDSAHPVLPHQSAGAGQAIESAYIIAKAVTEYLDRRAQGKTSPKLQRWTRLYQDIRQPRTQYIQKSSRETGLYYHLQVPEMEGKSIDQSLQLVARRMETCLERIWLEDIDVSYENAREKMLMEGETKLKFWKRRKFCGYSPDLCRIL